MLCAASGKLTYQRVFRYWSMAAAALRPAPIARITVAAPVTASPPANTPLRVVAPHSSATRQPRRSVSRPLVVLAISGLGEEMTHSTLDTFKTPEAWQYKLKDLAMQYIINARTAWFFVSGTPGSGKTHICSAIINKLVEYAQDVRYLKWREVIPQLKRVINDSDAFNAIMKPLKECDILYIDDFLKGTVTEADINLAYELINYRYAGKKRTIISGERSIDEIIELDEALGSRIYERSRRYHFETPKGANWRLK